MQLRLRQPWPSSNFLLHTVALLHVALLGRASTETIQRHSMATNIRYQLVSTFRDHNNPHKLWVSTVMQRVELSSPTRSAAGTLPRTMRIPSSAWLGRHHYAAVQVHNAPTDCSTQCFRDMRPPHRLLDMIREHTFDRPQDLQDNLFHRLHLIHSSCRERRYRVRL